MRETTASFVDRSSEEGPLHTDVMQNASSEQFNCEMENRIKHLLFHKPKWAHSHTSRTQIPNNCGHCGCVNISFGTCVLQQCCLAMAAAAAAADRQSILCMRTSTTIIMFAAIASMAETISLSCAEIIGYGLYGFCVGRFVYSLYLRGFSILGLISWFINCSSHGTNQLSRVSASVCVSVPSMRIGKEQTPEFKSLWKWWQRGQYMGAAIDANPK